MASKDTHDPGWNDPPIFTYDKATAIQQAAATKKGISLNKRVAFPLSGNTPKSVVSNDPTKPPPMSPMSLPPMSPMSLPPMSPPSAVTPTPCLTTPVRQDAKISKDKLEEVLKNLQIETICDEEIVKRIKVMEKMWMEDKLDDNVRLRIFELSEAIGKGDTDTADHIQKGLMVDNVSQCSSWMSGIRHLINKKKQS